MSDINWGTCWLCAHGLCVPRGWWLVCRQYLCRTFLVKVRIPTQESRHSLAFLLLKHWMRPWRSLPGHELTHVTCHLKPSKTSCFCNTMLRSKMRSFSFFFKLFSIDLFLGRYCGSQLKRKGGKRKRKIRESFHKLSICKSWYLI